MKNFRITARGTNETKKLDQDDLKEIMSKMSKAKLRVAIRTKTIKIDGVKYDTSTFKEASEETIAEENNAKKRIPTTIVKAKQPEKQIDNAPGAKVEETISTTEPKVEETTSITEAKGDQQNPNGENVD